MKVSLVLTDVMDSDGKPSVRADILFDPPIRDFNKAEVTLATILAGVGLRAIETYEADLLVGKPEKSPIPEIHNKADRPTGICHFLIRDVRLTGFKRGHKPLIGKRGDLRVVETSVDRDIIVAMFHPDGYESNRGFGEVIWPTYDLE